MKELYSTSAVEKLIDMYFQKGGEVITIEEGCLGWGTTLCRGEGLKTTVIQEKFINAWNSGHTITKYNKCPKKYSSIN